VLCGWEVNCRLAETNGSQLLVLLLTASTPGLARASTFISSCIIDFLHIFWSFFVFLVNVSCVFVLALAQDLLEQWAAEKLNFADSRVDSDYLEIAGTGLHESHTPAEVKREWDRLVDVDGGDCFSSVHSTDHNGHSSQTVKQPKNSGRKSVYQLVSILLRIKGGGLA